MISNIGAVVVTFNRLEKLKKALACYEQQINLPKYIIVVDNASTDGTKEYLESWKNVNIGYEKIVISLKENKGGAGGFYEGQKAAIQQDADWIMLADDDLYLDKNYISGINKFIETINPTEYSVISGTVIEHGDISLRNRTRINKLLMPFFKNIKKKEYDKSIFCCDLVSYLGAVLNKEKLIEAGLVKPEYFIWSDDWEHSCRMRKVGKIVCLPKITAEHDIKYIPNSLTWKIYYGYRNKVALLKEHFKILFPIYVSVLTIKAFLAIFLKEKNVENVKIRLAGIKDGIFGNMGLHPVYRPGWKRKK